MPMAKTTFKTMPSRGTCATATTVAERSMPMPDSLSSVSEDPFMEDEDPLEGDNLRQHDDLELDDDPLEKQNEGRPVLDLPLRFEDIGKVYPYPFDTGRKGLYRIFIVNRVEVGRLLCNFFPFLVRESTEDDGVEPRKKLTLAGFLQDGTPLPEVDIPASDFSAMSWVLEKWGIDCRMEVGNSKPHIANAILTTAPYAKRRTVYTVTGWKKIGGQWEYLLPGNSQYDVELGERLKGYGCEESYSLSDLTGTFSMIDFGLAPKKVLLPLLAFVFLTPLNHFLKEADCEPKFTLFLLGRTGSRKSTLAALMLSFFGSFTGSGLPLSFRDTANSVLYHLFQAKDVLLCVDDFHPDAPGSVTRMNGTAQAVMRAYGDRVGKNRLTEKSVPMASRPPQGNAILTGEFPADIGESGTARYFPVELHERDVDLEALSLFQDAAALGREVENGLVFPCRLW